MRTVPDEADVAKIYCIKIRANCLLSASCKCHLNIYKVKNENENCKMQNAKSRALPDRSALMSTTSRNQRLSLFTFRFV